MNSVDQLLDKNRPANAVGTCEIFVTPVDSRIDFLPLPGDIYRAAKHSYSGYQFSTGSLLSLRLFLPRDQAKKSEIYRDKETYTVGKYSVENEDCCTLTHSRRSGKVSRTIPGSLSMEHDRRNVAIGRE